MEMRGAFPSNVLTRRLFFLLLCRLLDLLRGRLLLGLLLGRHDVEGNVSKKYCRI